MFCSYNRVLSAQDPIVKNIGLMPKRAGGMDMGEFENKVVVVTGASQGIGLQTVKEFAKRNAKVVMVSSNIEKIQSAIGSIAEGKDNVTGISCDLSSQDEVKRLADAVFEKFGTIDIVVSNVGAFSDKVPWDQLDEKTWHDCFSLNTLSSYYCARYFGDFMIEHHIQGVIVCTGSSSALHLKRGRIHYTVSKSALHSMAQVLALDLARYGIRINVVSPGPTATEIVSARMEDPSQSAAEEERLKKIPLGRYAEMTDIADAILFLSSSRASFITGAILPVDGGYTIGEPW